MMMNVTPCVNFENWTTEENSNEPEEDILLLVLTIEVSNDLITERDHKDLF
jgi:hypothetical protein